MFNYLIALFVLFSSCIVFANEQEDLEKGYIETLALTFQGFVEQGSEQIWPHFQLADRPAVFHFKNGHVYAFGLARYSSLWEIHVIQRYPVLFCSQYPIALAPLQPAFPVEKQRAFVFSLDHGDKASFFPLLTFVHERFHIYQFQFFAPEKRVESVAADYENIDILTWMELEHRLLAFFLQASDPERKLHYLKDYLAVSQTRRHFLHSDSLKWEDHQQKMEGLADYVSVKTFQIFPYLSGFNAEQFLLDMRKKKTGNSIISAQDITKGRHYFVGAALGWALDFCGIENWKTSIEKGNISLQAILEDALSLGDRERQERLANVMQALGWMEIREQIQLHLEKQKRESEEIAQAFDLQEGIVIQMGIPSGHMSSGGSHQKSYQLGHKKAMVEDNSLATSQDQSWILRFKNIPLVLEEPNGERIFKLNPQVMLQLDGKIMSLEEIIQKNQAEIPFSSLSLKNEHCELDSKRSGKLCIERENIFFKFN